MPPELITHILESLPFHPYTERVATLASLCLVNHLFLEIARPLLYHEIHLDFWADYEEPSSQMGRLLSTLLNVKHCSELVKGIRISIGDVLILDKTLVPSLLSQLKAVDSIDIGGLEDGSEEELLQTIHEHQPRLRKFTMRTSTLSSSRQRKLLGTFKKLETLIGRFGEFADDNLPSSNDELDFRLRRFVSHSTLKRTTFESILASSWISLTSLAFAVSPEHADFNLRPLKNLDTLRIKIEDDFDRTLDSGELNQDGGMVRTRQIRIELFVIQIRMIIESTQSLPLKTLSITVEDHHIPDAIVPHLLLTSLPPSLRHFGTIFEFLDPKGVNYREVVKAVRDGRLSNLQKITIYSSDGLDAYTLQLVSNTWLRRKLNELDEELGIFIVAHCASSPELITPYFELEPYYEDVEVEVGDEGEWGAGSWGEDYDSEEPDEFRSDYEEDEDEDEGEEEVDE